MTDITAFDELWSAAANLVHRLKPGDVVGLRGNLGSGKTTFVKCVAETLGVTADVISPTFVYHQQYTLPEAVRGIVRLHHVDLYRLEREDDLNALGVDVTDHQGVSFVEWIDHAPLLASKAQYRLRLTLKPDGTRQLIEERS